MNRREFLVSVGGSLIAVPLVLELVSCGSNDSTGVKPSVGFTRTNDADNTGHSHQITVLCADLVAATGVTYTSTSSGHTHQVVLSISDVATLAAGGQVGPINSTVAAGHTHTWTLRKTASEC